ncbi:hypothetical protein FKM82_007344 [Ascaphus truei]
MPLCLSVSLSLLISEPVMLLPQQHPPQNNSLLRSRYLGHQNILSDQDCPRGNVSASHREAIAHNTHRMLPLW